MANKHGKKVYVELLTPNRYIMAFLLSILMTYKIQF